MGEVLSSLVRATFWHRNLSPGGMVVRECCERELGGTRLVVRHMKELDWELHIPESVKSVILTVT